MQVPRVRRVFGAALFGATALAVGGPAVAASIGGSANAKERVVGGPDVKINQYIKDTVHFASGTITVKSGGTVTLYNGTTDPHTLSIVGRKDLPGTPRGIDMCKICARLARAHGVDPNGPPPKGPPPILVVNAGAPGFNQPGDSIFLGPKHSPLATVHFKVTARRGTTLQFMCIIHPWMQGRILVK